MLASIAQDHTGGARDYVLGAVWVFLLPCLGLIAGCAVAAGWQGSAWQQVAAVGGGLAAGVLGGIAGRRITLRDQPGCSQDTLRGES